MGWKPKLACVVVQMDDLSACAGQKNDKEVNQGRGETALLGDFEFGNMLVLVEASL